MEFDLADNADMAETGRSNPALPGRSFPAKCGETEAEEAGFKKGLPSLCSAKFEKLEFGDGRKLGDDNQGDVLPLIRGHTDVPRTLVSTRGDSLRMVMVR